MMLFHTVRRVAEICRILNLEGQSERYEQCADRIAGAYHRAYFDARAGLYAVDGAQRADGDERVGYRQTMNILPLAFGAVPDQEIASVRAGLIGDIEQRTRGHLDCGAIGVKYLPQVLSDAGREDLAITVLTQKTRPGWAVWRDLGAHTLFEAWGEDARSRNHYFLGSPAAWIQQRIGGLRCTSPGWSTFEVKPVHDDRVRWARIAHSTVRGPAEVSWRRSDRHWDLRIVVPAGSAALVDITGAPARTLGGGDHQLILEHAEIALPTQS